MSEEWGIYVAARAIDVGGARAFNPRDAVPTSHVTRGVVSISDVVAAAGDDAQPPTVPPDVHQRWLERQAAAVRVPDGIVVECNRCRRPRWRLEWDGDHAVATTAGRVVSEDGRDILTTRTGARRESDWASRTLSTQDQPGASEVGRKTLLCNCRARNGRGAVRLTVTQHQLDVAFRAAASQGHARISLQDVMRPSAVLD